MADLRRDAVAAAKATPRSSPERLDRTEGEVPTNEPFQPWSETALPKTLSPEEQEVLEVQMRQMADAIQLVANATAKLSEDVMANQGELSSIMEHIEEIGRAHV